MGARLYPSRAKQKTTACGPAPEAPRHHPAAPQAANCRPSEHGNHLPPAFPCRVTRWSTCALSGQPLAAPVVACYLGRLYNKAAVLEWLLAKAGHFSDEADAHRYINQLREAGDAFDHITSIK